MHRRLWVVVLFIALITTYVSSEELKKNGVVFQWDYTYLLPENYIVGEVTRNVDGNMMIVTLEKSIEFVNMLGVNTPIADHPTKAANELEKEATDFTTAMCPVGSTVYLTYDSELRDDDFRLLSFVWFKIEDIWVLQNLNLIANGYGTFDATFPLKQSYKVILRNAEAYARVNEIGLWRVKEEVERSKPSKTSDASVIISNVEYRGSNEYVVLKNTGRTPVSLDRWKLVSIEGNQEYFLFEITLQPEETLSIHSGPAATGHVWTNTYIHNNRSDAVFVYDDAGDLVDYLGWGDYQ